MNLRIRSTHQTAEPRMEERIVTKTLKCEGVQVQNQNDADRFFDVHGIVHAEFLPQGQTINQNVYKNILRHLMRLVREKRKELWETRSWLLHHDNAPAHNALGIWKFHAKNCIKKIQLKKNKNKYNFKKKYNFRYNTEHWKNCSRSRNLSLCHTCTVGWSLFQNFEKLYGKRVKFVRFR